MFGRLPNKQKYQDTALLHCYRTGRSCNANALLPENAISREMELTSRASNDLQGILPKMTTYDQEYGCA